MKSLFLWICDPCHGLDLSLKRSIKELPPELINFVQNTKKKERKKNQNDNQINENNQVKKPQENIKNETL